MTPDYEVLWARFIDDDNFHWREVVIGPNSEVYISNSIEFEVRLDDTDPDFVLTEEADGAAYVVKFNSDGSLAWHLTYGQNAPQGTVLPAEITVDALGNIIVGGSFYTEQIDLDPSENELLISADGEFEAHYIQKFDADGNWVWGKKSQAEIKHMACDSENNIYLRGMN